METVEIKTLVDITNTGVRRANQGTQQELEQYKNWITLNQCIEIRSIINYDFPPTVEEVDVKGLGFGSKYKGKHKVWTWRLSPDRSNAFAEEGDPVAGLVTSIDQVPFIKNLTETINIDRPVFELSDNNLKNTVVKLITGNE